MLFFDYLSLLMIYVIVLALILSRAVFRDEHLSPRSNSLFWTVKILTTAAIGLIYTHGYPTRVEADIFKYFDDSIVLFSALPEHPSHFFQMITGMEWEPDVLFANYYDKMNGWNRPHETFLPNDARMIIRFDALLHLVSMKSFGVLSGLMSLFSFCGFWWIYRAAKKYLNASKTVLALVIFMVPSVVFWSSSNLKEALLFFGIGLVCMGAGSNGSVLKQILFILIGIGFMAAFKVYLLLLLIPAAIAFGLSKNLKSSAKVVGVGVGVWLSFLMLGIVTSILSKDLNLMNALMQKQSDFINQSMATDPGSFIGITALNGTLWSLIKTAPEALLNAILSPLPFSWHNPFSILAGIENLAAMALFVIGLTVLPKKWDANTIRVVVACTLPAIALLLLIGYTTPVVGAIVRYRIPAVLLLALAAVQWINWQQLSVNPRFKK